MSSLNPFGANDFVKNLENRSEQDLNSLQDMINKLNENKRVIPSDEKLQLLRIVLGYLSESPAKDFFTLVVKTELEESAKHNEMLFAALGKAIVESSKKQIKQRTKVFTKPSSFLDITMLVDEDFEEMLHVTRITAKLVIERIRQIPVEFPTNQKKKSKAITCNEPIDKIIFLVLWFLRHHDNKLEDAVKMFELGSVENANRLLDRGFMLIKALRADAGILWPTEEGFMITAASIDERFKFPGVAAILDYKLITCESGHRMMLQGLCNEKGMFIDTFTSYETRPHLVFKLSRLENKLQELKSGLVIACEDFGIRQRNANNMMTPYRKGSEELPMNEQVFNLMHELVISIVKSSFNQLFKRFQRLNNLEKCDPEIVNVAFILHNYCIKLNDSSHL